MTIGMILMMAVFVAALYIVDKAIDKYDRNRD